MSRELTISKPSCAASGEYCMKNIRHCRPGCAVTWYSIERSDENTGLSRHSHGRPSAAKPELANSVAIAPAIAKYRPILKILIASSLFPACDRDDAADDRAEARVLGRENRFDAELEQSFAIALGDYSAHHDRDVARAATLEQIDCLARDGHVRAREARDREYVHVFLERRRDHLLGRLLESREHYFHPGLHAGVGEQLDRVDVSVEARLAERDANFPCRWRYRHLERANAHAGFKNRRRVAAAADAHERISPFADGAAGAGEVDSRLDYAGVAAV